MVRTTVGAHGPWAPAVAAVITMKFALDQKFRSPAIALGQIHAKRRFMGGLIIVSASYDADANLWSAHSTDLGGTFLQATSWKILVATVPGAVEKLLPRGFFRPAHDIAIEVAGHASMSTSKVARAPASVHSDA